MLDRQDINELIGLVIKAWSEEVLAGGIRMGSPTTRAVNLKQLEMKLYRIGAQLKTTDLAEVVMLDGRQPPAMGDTQADERY